MHIDINTSQKIILTQKFEQSVKILQMDCQELTSFIQQEVEENPVMEIEYTFDELKDEEKFKKKIEWLESIDDNKVYYQDTNDENDIRDLSCHQPMYQNENNIHNFLMEQLNPMELDSKVYNIAEYIASSLDERGYFCDSVERISALLNINIETVKESLSLIQSLEPWGIGARDLQECLLIQINKMGNYSPEIELIVNNYLEELSQSKFNLVSKQLKLSIEKVKDLYNIIQTLNPNPGCIFSELSRPSYVIPDVIVVRFKDYYDVILNDFTIPSIRISHSYIKLMNNTRDSEAIKYINKKFEHAKFIVNCIEQRNNTLINVAKVIIDMQSEFFAKGSTYLRPMLLKDIAERLEISESTVSRAIRGKYMQTQWGTYEMKYFFAYRLNSSSRMDMTSNDVKLEIKDIIQNEDCKKPYSDNDISNILGKKGINISRRTVAKYREEMIIPNTSGRRNNK